VPGLRPPSAPLFWAALQLADSTAPVSGNVLSCEPDNTGGMAIAYAIPDVETSERAREISTLSDVPDAWEALVGEFEAYSQAPIADALEYEFETFDAPRGGSEEPCEDGTVSPLITLAAVFFVVQIVLVVEVVFAVFFEPVNSDDPVGSVITALLGGALFGNFGAGIAAAWVVEANRRWQATVPTQAIGLNSDD
jgi:hypothetical protein